MLELSFVVIRDLVLDLEPFWFVKVVSGYWTISSICSTSMSHFTFQLNCEIMLVCNHPVCWLSGVNNLLLCKIGSCLFAGVCLIADHGRSRYKVRRIFLSYNFNHHHLMKRYNRRMIICNIMISLPMWCCSVCCMMTQHQLSVQQGALQSRQSNQSLLQLQHGSIC